MELFRPRLTDFHGIHKSQSDLDFAIQFFDEDIPLYVDPFLLYKSPSLQDQALHTALTKAFNHLNFLIRKGREEKAGETLVNLSECPEVGLGVSKNRSGVKIGIKQANQILSLFKDIPEYGQFGFTHFEVIRSNILVILINPSNRNAPISPLERSQPPAVRHAAR